MTMWKIWDWWFTPAEPPPQVVLVPPLFDFPPLAARNRMLESSYDLLFGKLPLRCLFDDYFEAARHFSTRLMLKPNDDPHVDLIATVAGPIDHESKEDLVGNAQFRWQSDVDDHHHFMDVFVSNTEPTLLIRSCAYLPKFGVGAFGTFPVLLKNRISSKDYGVMGLRYGSPNLSAGATVMPFALGDKLPRSAWLVSKLGRLTVGVQYEPQLGSKDVPQYKNLKNWSCAIGYGLGSGSPLSPSFNFGLELAKNSQVSSFCIFGAFIQVKFKFFIFYSNCFVVFCFMHERTFCDCLVCINAATCACSLVETVGRVLTWEYLFIFLENSDKQFIASFYQHVVVQRRVKNPFEENEVVGITNYIDFGFELQTRINDDKASNNAHESTFQVAASWQANKNILLKGKVGPLSSCISLAFKSWWKPSFTFNISATRDRKDGNTALGFGIHVENLRNASYERADPNFVMLTPSKEHLAESIHWQIGKRPVLQSDVNSGNFDGVPTELRPLNVL